MTSPIPAPAPAPVPFATPARESAGGDDVDFGEVLEETQAEKKEDHAPDADTTAIAIPAPATLARDPRLLFGWRTPAGESASPKAAHAAILPCAAALQEAEAATLTPDAPGATPLAASLPESLPEAFADSRPSVNASPIGEDRAAARTAETVFAVRALPNKAPAPTLAPAAEASQQHDRNDSSSQNKDSGAQQRQAARPTARAEPPAAAATPAAEEPARARESAVQHSATHTAAPAAVRAFSADVDTPAPQAAAQAAPAAPVAENDPAPAPKTVQEISMQVAGDENQRVEVRVAERAGEVRLTVRSADEPLARELRGNLNELSTRLSETGYRAETWQPAGSDAAAFSDHQDPTQQNDAGRQQRQQRQPGQQQPQQQEDRRQRPAWLEEFEQWRLA